MDPELGDQESGFTLSWGSPLLHFPANFFSRICKISQNVRSLVALI